MTDPVRIVIPLQPEGKRRHRSRVVNPADKGRSPWVQEYPDPAQNEHLDQFAQHLRKVWRRPPSANPFKLGVVAFMPLPTSKPRWWQELARRGEIQPTTKPDLSNIVKLVEDVANGIIWRDDSQIVGYLQTARFYSDAPKYVITVQELPSEDQIRAHCAGRQLQILDASGNFVNQKPATRLRA